MNDAEKIDTRLEDKLQDLRKNLLDISNKNKLINFKHSSRSRRIIRIVDEVPSQIYDCIVREEKGMAIKPLKGLDEPDDEKTVAFKNELELEYKNAGITKEEDFETEEEFQKKDRTLRNIVRERLGLRKIPDPKDIKSLAEFLGINSDYDLPTEQNGKKHNDLSLQTLYSVSDLNRRLLTIHSEANTNEKDKGITTLYLIFGFLEWRESPISTTKITSPLLLLPISLECKITTRGGTYRINPAGRLTINKCLDLKLNDSFKMRLPEISLDESGFLAGSIEDYFKRIESAIEKNPKWKVRRFVSLTNLDFNKVVIYEDLDPERWKSSPLSLSSTIRHVFWGDDGKSKEGSNIAVSNANFEYEDFDIDKAAIDNRENDLLIKEADSSQHAAILDAMNGNNIVVSGPPGTGKSQTITNLIAQALGRGKKVLFMCEKLAALKVVKNRLDHCEIAIPLMKGKAASLGDFCFELHSNTSKKTIHSAMAKRLEIPNSPILGYDFDQNVKNLNKKRQQLRNLSANLYKNIGNSGKNYVQAVWERERLREYFREEDDIDSFFWDKDASQYSASEITDIIEHIRLYTQQYLQIQKVFPDISQHPWHWVKSCGLSKISQREIVQKLNNILETIQKNIGVLSEICNILCLKTSVTNKIFENISLLLDIKMPDIDKKIIRRFESAEYLNKIMSELEIYSDFLNATSKAKKYTDRINELKAIIENGNIVDILNRIQSFALPIPCRTLIDIETEYANVEKTLRYLGSFFKLADKFPAVCEYDGKDFSIIGIKKIIETIKYLNKFDKKYFNFIFSEFCNEDEIKQNWNEILNESFILERELKKFQFQLNIPNLMAENRIIQSAFDLENNASFFKWIFAKEAKSARKILSNICPEFKKLPKAEKLSVAKKIAELKTRIEHFAENPYVLKISVDTLFTPDGTSVLRDYDEVIKSVWRFILLNPNFKNLILNLLSMPISSFEEFVKILEDLNVEELINILYEDNSVNNDRNISALKEEFSSRSKYLKDIIVLSNSIYLKNDIPLSGIYELKELCAQANEKYSRLNEMLEFILVLKDKTIEVINDIVRYLHVRDNITADEPLKINLLDKNFYEEFSKKISICIGKYYSNLGELKDLLKDLSNFAGGVPEFLDISKSNDISLDVFSEGIISNIKKILSHSDLLGEYCDLNEIKGQIEQDGTWNIISGAQENRMPPEKFEKVFLMAYLYTLLDRASISGISKVAEIENTRNEFNELDSKLYNENIQYIANKLLKVNLKEGVHIGSTRDYTELSLVKHEASKKQAHIPIRMYLSRALDTVMALKPCFMMSPQTVSQYLPCKGGLFDMLIIDEASQMLPSDAIAAMARSKQVVIVGDKQQLPPTNFFSANLSDLDEDVEDGESILDIADSRLSHKRMLSWHYRARHESLINFSNRNFYDNKLVVFPSSEGRSSNYGIKFIHVENGIYENGINEEEANMLISYLPDIIKTHKDKSIGIVAINQKQAELLREKFDKLMSENSEIAAYVSSWQDKLEEFFIKNLENVQGDERDVIIISFVYGQSLERNGVSGNFGPINKQNGYRRLNVLFSRAKEEIHVFTSMSYEQVKVNAENLPSSNGPSALKNYLYYAANGGMEENENSHETPVNDFEASVGNFLKRKGFNVRYQVGSIGYYIDIVIDSNTGKHIIGIECDGAQYHSSKSARDRDKLRQDQLENLGWKIYRVWSTDWFHNRNLAEQRLLNAVNEAFQNQPIQ
ncbi:MAG: DUF4011 domain-containing protein [Opitutales bacterium]|nr:DUF4011 domain-containing protein [Opitutales bacterium]